MRNELIEGVIIGATIGLAVVAIRALFVGDTSAGQALALVLAGAVLCGVQLLLVLRRAGKRSSDSTEMPQAAPRRPGRQNPFAQELTRNWTGLDDRLPVDSALPSEAPSEQSDT
jgi:hypothetical protein